MDIRSEKCHSCDKYDTCNSTAIPADCDDYEYYQCTNCLHRVVESDGIPRCFRGGIKCKDIRLCGNFTEVREK